VIVSRMSSGQAHDVQVRVLAVKDHLALANWTGWACGAGGAAVSSGQLGRCALGPASQLVATRR